MTLEYTAVGIITVLVMAYLVLALLRPEQF
jgi:K+-transporting ATPase KdpF subunit